MFNTKSDTYHIFFWKSIPISFLRREIGDGFSSEKKYIYDEARIREAAESGMTILDCQYDDLSIRMHMPKSEQEEAAKYFCNEEEVNQEILKLCEKYNLFCNISDDRIKKALRNEPDWQQGLEDMVKAYRGYSSLFSFHIKDEPGTREEIDQIARIKNYLAQLCPETESYVNLLPGNGAKYEADVEYFIEQVRPAIISYDRYYFCKRKLEPQPLLSSDEFISERLFTQIDGVYEKFDAGGYFENMEIIHRQSLKHNIPWMTTVLLTQHAHYRELTEGELRYEVFTALAYGATRMSYYTYWTYHTVNFLYTNGMIERDGSRTRYYYIVQNINRELKTVGPYIKKSRSSGVYHIGQETDNVVYWPENGAEFIKSIYASRLIAGFFDDQTVLLVNKDYRNHQRISFRLSDQYQASQGNESILLRLDKVTGKWLRCYAYQGQYFLDLQPGDGELLRVERV
jgi:hypothetical protein